MQRLRYSITQDDLVAFSCFHAEHSPTIKKSWRGQTVFFTIAFGAIALWSSNVLGPAHLYTLFLIVVAISSPFTMPRYLRRRYARHVRRMHAEGSNASLLGNHEVTADDSGLMVTTPGDETRLKWQAIERVASTAEHAFIYISANQAVVVPRGAVQVGDVDRFLAYVRERITHVTAV